MRGNDAVKRKQHLFHHRVQIRILVQQELMQLLHRRYPTRPELAMEVAVKHRVTRQPGLAATALALNGEILYTLQPDLTQQRPLTAQRSLYPSQHVAIALRVDDTVDALAAARPRHLEITARMAVHKSDDFFLCSEFDRTKSKGLAHCLMNGDGGAAMRQAANPV